MALEPMPEHHATHEEARPRDLLYRDHHRLEKLFERLQSAFDAGDSPETQSLWRELERGIRAHFRAEETELFPLFEKVSPEESAALHAEHEDIRRALARLGVEVDLHLVTPATAKELLDRLRAHAAREDTLMYAWADKHAGGLWDRLRGLLSTLANAARTTLSTSEDVLPRGPTLRLVCVNDVYTLDNLPRLRTLVQHFADTDPADVLVTTLAGDFLAPSMLSSLDSGRGMVDCMNAVPITHVTFGNHEDDVPLVELQRRVTELRAIWLATNVPGFSPALPRSSVLEIAAPGGRAVRVGLLGVVMSDGAIYRGAPFGVASVAPANEAAIAEARSLVEQGCAVVVPLTHQPAEDDRALARAARNPPFPVIVGGHEHEILVEQVEGTWIVKAGADAVHAAVIDLAWPAVAPASGPDVPRVSLRIEDVAAYPDDAGLRAQVERHMRAVYELEKATLKKVAPGERMSSVGTRAHQTTMGTLVCSHVRDALGAEGCIFNGGGIRAARDYPTHFTYGDLKAEVPFDNEVVVARLPGRVLAEAIAASRSHAPQESGGFLQVDDGMVFDGTHLVAIDGAPLDEARDYRIGVVRNLFTGLDHIGPLVRFAEEHPERVPPAGSGREIKQLLVHALSLDLWRQLGRFDDLDTNRDGVIDASEIAAAVARVTKESASTVTVGLVLDAVDTDRDRVVSRTEAAAAEKSGARRGA